MEAPEGRNAKVPETSSLLVPSSSGSSLDGGQRERKEDAVRGAPPALVMARIGTPTAGRERSLDASKLYKVAGRKQKDTRLGSVSKWINASVRYRKPIN